MNNNTPIQEFSTLRAANLSRVATWMPGGLNSWTRSDWGLATGGELGEAMNAAKKLNRHEGNIAGNRVDFTELHRNLADEMADTAIYLDLWAASEGIDLDAAIASKFNEKSAQMGFPQRIVIPPVAPMRQLALSELYALLFASAEPSAFLDGEIWRVFSPEGDWVDFSENNNGAPETLWMRRDPTDSCAFDRAPEFTRDFKIAETLLEGLGVVPEYSFKNGMWTVALHSQNGGGAASQLTTDNLAIAICATAIVCKGAREEDYGEDYGEETQNDVMASLVGIIPQLCDEFDKWVIGSDYRGYFPVHREPDNGQCISTSDVSYFATKALAIEYRNSKIDTFIKNLI